MNQCDESIKRYLDQSNVEKWILLAKERIFEQLENVITEGESISTVLSKCQACDDGKFLDEYSNEFELIYKIILSKYANDTGEASLKCLVEELVEQHEQENLWLLNYCQILRDSLGMLKQAELKITTQGGFIELVNLQKLSDTFVTNFQKERKLIVTNKAKKNDRYKENDRYIAYSSLESRIKSFILEENDNIDEKYELAIKRTFLYLILFLIAKDRVSEEVLNLFINDKIYRNSTQLNSAVSRSIDFDTKDQAFATAARRGIYNLIVKLRSSVDKPTYSANPYSNLSTISNSSYVHNRNMAGGFTGKREGKAQYKKIETIHSNDEGEKVDILETLLKFNRITDDKLAVERYCELIEDLCSSISLCLTNKVDKKIHIAVECLRLKIQGYTYEEIVVKLKLKDKPNTVAQWIKRYIRDYYFLKYHNNKNDKKWESRKRSMQDMHAELSTLWLGSQYIKYSN